jgi:hypothetical protein
VFAGKAVRVPGRLEHATREPLHGAGVAGRERRLAIRDVGVPLHRSRALLRDLRVVFGLRDGQRLPPLRYSLPMFGLGRLETTLRLRQLAVITRAQEAVEPLRRDRRELAPVGRGHHLAEFARIEWRHLRRGHEPFEGQRGPRQDTRQHLRQDRDLLLHGGGLGVRFGLPGLQVRLLASLFLLPVLLALFSVQPIVFPALRRQAALELRQTPAAGHRSPGPRHDGYGNDDNRDPATSRSRHRNRLRTWIGAVLPWSVSLVPQ